MKIERLFPIVQIVICFAAAVVYFWKRDVRHGIYWVLAGLLTATVTSFK